MIFKYFMIVVFSLTLPFSAFPQITAVSKDSLVLGTGSYLGEALTLDKRYRLEVYAARIKVYSGRDKYFIKDLICQYPIEKTAYKANTIFWKYEGKEVWQSWRLLNDQLGEIQKLPPGAGYLNLILEKKNEASFFRFALGKNSMRMGAGGVVVLPDKVLLANIREVNLKPVKSISSKWSFREGVVWEGKEPLFQLQSLLQKDEAVEQINAQGILTSKRYLEFFPNLVDFAKLLKDFSWEKTSELLTMEILWGFLPWEESMGYHYVDLLLAKKEWQKAFEVLTGLKSYVKNNSLWNEKYGVLLFESNKGVEAKGYLARAKTANAFYFLGKIAFQAKRYKSAIYYNLQAIKQDKNFYQAYNNLAIAYQQVKNYTKAEAVLLEGIEASPLKEDLYYNLGLFYKAQGKSVLSMVLWEKVLEINPKHLEAANQLYYVYLKQGQEEEALQLVRQVLERYPSDAVSHYNIALLYQKRKDWAKAVFHFQAFLSFSENEKLKKMVEKEIQELIGKLKEVN